MSRLYVYALIDTRLPRTSLFGHTIDAVPVGDIYALAERTTRAPSISEDSLREQHAIVMQLAERSPAILPARFGSLVEVSELKEIVTLRREQLREALNLVRGRQQMTLRLVLAEENDAADKRPPAPGASRAARSGTQYLAARRAAAGYPLPDAVARLNAAMRRHIVADKAEPGQGRVRVTIYHLIAQGSSGTYRRALDRTTSGVAPFTLEHSGPWPPFAFAPELLA